MPEEILPGLMPEVNLVPFPENRLEGQTAPVEIGSGNLCEL